MIYPPKPPKLNSDLSFINLFAYAKTSSLLYPGKYAVVEVFIYWEGAGTYSKTLLAKASDVSSLFSSITLCEATSENATVFGFNPMFFSLNCNLPCGLKQSKSPVTL